MSDIKNVILIGAGGNLGKTVLEAFQKSSFQTTVLSREESSSTFPAGVKVIKANYQSADSLVDAFKGQDAVVSIVTTHGAGDQQRFVDAAIAAGVKRFVPSEFGSNTASAEVRAKVPFFSAKRGLVEYLQSKEDAISWTGLITGGFYDWGIKVGFLGFDRASKTATIVDDGESVITYSTLHQIGQALVQVLKHQDITKNQYVYISSFDITQQTILSTIEKVSGDKWTVAPKSHDDLYASGHAGLKKGDFVAAADLIKAIAFSNEGLGDHRKLLWNDRLGLKKENLEAATKAGLDGNDYDGSQ